jgi:hypothetical protein
MLKLKNLQIFFIAMLLLFFPLITLAAHSGKIYIQVEKNGEAWYIYPVDNNRYYLGRPADAFAIMRNLGLGITNDNLSQIPIGVLEMSGTDSDWDGLTDDMEKAIGTNLQNPDSDNDDFSDNDEIQAWTNPNGEGTLPRNQGLINKLRGRILLQVQTNGEAWYVNPTDDKRYYLGRPSDAFEIMRKLGIGITNADLEKIPTNYTKDTANVDNFYNISYPSYWSVELDKQVGQSFKSMPITHSLKVWPDTIGGYITIYILEPKKHNTLEAFSYKDQYASEYLYETFYAGLKPAKRQKYQYQRSWEKDGVYYDRPAFEYIDIMLSTQSFIHFTMASYAETDVAEFETYLNAMVDSLVITAK